MTRQQRNHWQHEVIALNVDLKQALWCAGCGTRDFEHACHRRLAGQHDFGFAYRRERCIDFDREYDRSIHRRSRSDIARSIFGQHAVVMSAIADAGINHCRRARGHYGHLRKSVIGIPTALDAIVGNICRIHACP